MCLKEVLYDDEKSLFMVIFCKESEKKKYGYMK